MYYWPLRGSYDSSDVSSPPSVNSSPISADTVPHITLPVIGNLVHDEGGDNTSGQRLDYNNDDEEFDFTSCHPFPHVLQKLTVNNNNNKYQVKLMCNRIYADGRTSPSVYSGDYPLVLEIVVDNVRRRNGLITKFIDESHIYTHGFSMLASFDHRLRINRLIVPFESIVPSTIPFLDGETVNLVFGERLSFTALYPHLICPPPVQDYLIPASDPDDYQQSFVFYAGFGHGANRHPLPPYWLVLSHRHLLLYLLHPYRLLLLNSLIHYNQLLLSHILVLVY